MVTMAVMDEFKEKREALKHGTKKEKAKYFWDYYRYHTLAIIIAIVVVGSFGYNFLTKTETVFYAAIINAAEKENEIFEDELIDLLELEEKEGIILDASMYLNYGNHDQVTIGNQQKIITLVAAASVDVVVGDEETLTELDVNKEMYSDLTMYFTEEELEQYSGGVYYQQRGEEEVPVGLYIEENSLFSEQFYYGEPAVAVIIVNTLQEERALEFMNLLMEKGSK